LVVVGADVVGGGVVVGRAVVVDPIGRVVVGPIVNVVTTGDDVSLPDRTTAAETPVPRTTAARAPARTGSGRTMTMTVSVARPFLGLLLDPWAPE